jgi:hypothetical protein
MSSNSAARLFVTVGLLTLSLAAIGLWLGFGPGESSDSSSENPDLVSAEELIPGGALRQSA